MDSRDEARLIALACSEALEGRDRWSMRLLADKAKTSVAERRRGRESAEEVRRLVEEDYPQAARVRLVLANLSTLSASALYETFPP